MVSVELSTREGASAAVVALRGELDVADAAKAGISGRMAAATTPAAGNPALPATASHTPGGLLAAGDAA